jgi:transmembrane sensor
MSQVAERDELRRQASAWLVRRDAGMSVFEAKALEVWLQQSPLHREAMANVESTWAFLHAPRKAGVTATVLERLGARRRARLRRNVALSCVAAVACVVTAVLIFPTRRLSDAPVAMPDTVTVAPEARVLPDGSIVELNEGAAIAVHFAATSRSVALLRGEAEFKVRHDASRPFILTAGGVAIRDLGTAFCVKLVNGGVDVLVTEGQVAVRSAAAGIAKPAIPVSIVVQAGRRLSVPPSGLSNSQLQIERLSPAQVAAALAWRGRRVEFNSTPLSEAIAVFNRQNRIKIEIRDPSLSGRLVGGVFWTDNPAGFSRLLTSSLGLHADFSNPDRIGLSEGH